MPSPSFQPVAGAPTLFELPRGDADHGWAGYLLGRGDPMPSTDIPLADAFATYTGHYLFALERPDLSDGPGFAHWVRTYLDCAFGSGGEFTGRACFWIPPGLPGSSGCNGASQWVLTFHQNPFGTYTDSDFNNPLGEQVTFTITEGTAIGAAGETLVLSSSGGAAGVGIATSPAGFGPTVAPNQATIPLTGRYSGCCLLAGRIDPARFFQVMDVGVRYAIAAGGRTYPLLRGTAVAPFAFAGALDPLDPTNACTATNDADSGVLRSILAVTGATPLASWLRTAANQDTSLIAQGGVDASGAPVPNAGGLAFEYVAEGAGRTEGVYLVPAGDWAVAVAGTPTTGAGAGAATALLCGIYGAERLSLRGYRTDGPFDRVRFIAKRAAYAPVFPFSTASLADPGSGDLRDRLTPDRRTAWGMVVSGEGGDVQYHAQPEGSPLYQGASAALALLPPLDTATSLPGTAGLAVPWTPYAGVASSSVGIADAQLGAFESQILAPTRRAEIARVVDTRLQQLKQTRALRASAMPAGSGNATTPGGLVAQVQQGSGGSDYLKVLLGMSDPQLTAQPEFAFYDLAVKLQSLFQTNQVFAVVVNPASLGSFANAVCIAGWRFAAAVGEGVSATDYRNVLIIKFGEGTVQQRVANPNAWVDATDFSVMAGAADPSLALTGLSSWLQDYIAQALAENERKNPLYANFARIVTDPGWNGVLVLRAHADASGLPEQIRGLAPGMDMTQFAAHHFGVTVSRVQANDDATVSLQAPSSLFGLVDYQHPAFRQNVANGGDPNSPLALPVRGDYDFTVLQLQALFVNAALIDFRSRIQLTANRLFSSAVRAAYGRTGRNTANAVVLPGQYVKQGTSATYVFEQAQTTRFLILGPVLRAVAFDRVQFNTLSTAASGEILSRFLVWGRLDFAALPGPQADPVLDIFSFGSAADAGEDQLGQGLAFSNLQVRLDAATAASPITYTFDASNLGLDGASSQLRDGSLYPGFALQLDSFLSVRDGRRPVDVGYLAVRSDVALSPLTGEWYGVVCKISMGTAGALASSAGFQSRLLLAWSAVDTPGASNVPVFIGIQLPGTAPGAKLLSLQGVLKVAIDTLRLRHDPIVGSTSGQRAFTLQLGNIGLKLFGIAKLPPNGSIDFFLFGDPAGSGSLGWYAAYKATDQVAIASPEVR